MDDVSRILLPHCAHRVIFSSAELSILSFLLLVGAYLYEEVPRKNTVLYPAHVCACVCVISQL